ncbi:SWIB/MDM2 domain-containing protein [Russula brevipes]|nr:SWIB/MDM2 domain-containing protein [Russula brevipes]
MQVVDLEPHIHAILSAPGTDLSTISAKRVRRLLLEQEDVTQDLIKDNKQAIDELISTVFARVSEENGFQHDEDGGAGGASAESAEPPPPPKKRHRASLDDHGSPSSGKPAKVSTAGDEALARQLSEAINGRGRSSRSGASGAPSARARGRGRGRGRGRSGKANGSRSADTIDDSGNEGSDGDESKKKRGRGLSKEYILSEPLAALVQEDSLSRPQVVKRLWAYIKTNNLQNPTNGREILCDGAFRAVFNTDKIDMFKMNKELGKHLSEPSETTA